MRTKTTTAREPNWRKCAEAGCWTEILEGERCDEHAAPREPAYGAAAERYSAERELGLRVLEILRQRDALGLKDSDRSSVHVGLRSEARALGLLDEEVRP